MRFRRKILVATGVGTAGLALVGGLAFAAWSSSGAGSASSTATVALNSTITPTSGSGLYPGATKDVTVTINNGNDYPVIVTSITAGSSNATAQGCPAGTVTTDAKSAAAGITNASAGSPRIAPNSTATYTLTARMAANADNACQGNSFTLPLTAQILSNAS